MVKFGFKAALVALAVTSASSAYAQSTASDTGTASIKVVRPISVAKVRDLAFGTVVRPSTASGSVTIAADDAGARGVSGGVVALASTTTSGKFTVSGEGAQEVSITIPSQVTLNRTGGGGTLTLVTSNNLTDAAHTTLGGSLGGDGSTTVYVGGSIAVASGTATGDYSNTFTVSAAYN